MTSKEKSAEILSQNIRNKNATRAIVTKNDTGTDILSVKSEPTVSKTVTETTASKSVSPTSKNISVSKQKNILASIKEKNPITEEATVISSTTNKDTDDILAEIKEHLSKFKTVDETKFDTTAKDVVLDLGNGDKIGTKCMLHYLSQNDQLFPKEGTECAPIIGKYLTDNELDLTKLFKISGDFKRDHAFYKNLYEFIISLANGVTKDARFKNMDGLQQFINGGINYFNSFINKYQVIDEPLINSTYNLLLLLNAFTYKRANVSANADMSKLIKINNDVQKAIQENINLYNSIDTKKFSQNIAFSETSTKLNNEIKKLIEALTERFNKLGSQKIQLEKNIKELSSETNYIRQIVTDPNIKTLANNIMK